MEDPLHFPQGQPFVLPPQLPVVHGQVRGRVRQPPPTVQNELVHLTGRYFINSYLYCMYLRATGRAIAVAFFSSTHDSPFSQALQLQVDGPLERAVQAESEADVEGEEVLLHDEDAVVRDSVEEAFFNSCLWR